MEIKSKTRCPICGHKLEYVMKASIEISIDATNLKVSNKIKRFEETIKCKVCGAVLPTKVVNLVLSECRPIAKANSLYEHICSNI